MKKRETILVVDVESTCWHSRETEGISEIIEIGVTELSWDGDWITVSRRPESLPVRPQFSTVSQFCTDLTGWTDKALQDAPTYAEVISYLRKEYDPKNAIFASWGGYDRKMFEKMSDLHKVAFPFNNDHLNIKALFGAQYAHVCGVSEALEFFSMSFEGTPHRGKDDSYNIAKLLIKLLG